MAVKAGQIYKITHDFESWNLNDPNPGRQEFFQIVMSALENTEMGFATFNIGVPMDKGVGGYFTDHLSLEKICLPDIVKVDEANHLLTFTDVEPDPEDPDDEPMTAEEAFAVFVHEACHFLHFSRDNGVFTSPLMKGKSYTMQELTHSPKVRREAEYEAGYRSAFYDKVYKMYPGSRQILDTNLINMLNYDTKNQSPEWIKRYKELVRPFYGDAVDEKGIVILDKDGNPVSSGELIDKKGYKEFTKCIRDQVQKFSEWADPKHEIKGIL